MSDDIIIVTGSKDEGIEFSGAAWHMQVFSYR